VTKQICSWLPPFCKQNLVLFVQPRWQLRRTYFFNHLMFSFNEFAFTVQVKHKINSIQILGFILICLYFTTGHFHSTHVYFAKNVAYFPYNSWLSFQRLCRLLWGYHFCFVDSNHASNNSVIPVLSWHVCLFWSPRCRQPP